ncbi:MAG: SEL1-like repeat protein [Verrucomicrobiales bacterium]|nr:SEL1-like repeat protein [Verrucomicrobiales bacterium]
MIAEFDQFRFVRDRQGSLAELPSDRNGERVFLVLDCRDFRLALLHIFEGLAAPEDGAGDRFEREIAAIRERAHPRLTPILGSGRDDTELYYAEGLPGGEPLGGYLRRVGPLSETLAVDLTLDLLSILSSHDELPNCLSHFDFGRFFVTQDRPSGSTGLRLHVADYGGWLMPPCQSTAEVVERVALALYSLLSGFVFRFAPFSLFDREARQTTENLRSLLHDVLKGEPGHPRHATLESFTAALRAVRAGLEAGQEGDLPPVKCFFRDWLMAGHDSIDAGPGYRVSGPSVPEDLGYAFDAAGDRSGPTKRLRFQLFPGFDSVPREGWLEQHLSALRRPGRGLPNQLSVVALETWGRCLLIGEERVEGVSIASLVRSHGALRPGSVREIAAKVNAALDVIERTAGAPPVWRLGARDVYLVTGDASISALVEAAQLGNVSVWRRLPVRLRLHQTAEELIEGLNLPAPVMERVRAGGKTGERGRRAAVLLPLISEMLTGRRFRWTEPVPRRPGLPIEVTQVLEQLRLRLCEDPGQVQSLLLDELSRALGLDDTVVPAETSASDEDSPVSAPVGVLDDFDPDAAAAKAATFSQTTATNGASRLSRSLKPFGLHTTRELVAEKQARQRFTAPAQPAADVEFLGVIADGEFHEAPTASEAKPADVAARGPVSESQAEPAVESLGLIEDAAVMEAPIAQAEAAATPISAPERSGFRRLLFPFGRKPETAVIEAPAETAAEEEKPVDACPDDEAGEIQAKLPAIDGETPAIEANSESIEQPEPSVSPALDETPVAESPPVPTEPESREPVEVHSESGETGEPMSFLAFMTSATPEVEATDESAAVQNAAASEEKSATVAGGSVRSSSLRESLGLPEMPLDEERPAATEPDSEPLVAAGDGEPSRVGAGWHRYGRLVGISLIGAALVWAVTYGLVAIAASVDRETFAESLEPALHRDYLREAARDLATAAGSLPTDAGEKSAVGDDLKAITRPEEAIRLGQEAVAGSRLPDAVNFFLRALELEPKSTEARDQLWSTLDAWSRSETAGQPSDAAAARLERAAEHAPRAAWLLADYYLPRDRALGLLWLRRSAEAGQPRHQRILGLILSEVPDSLPEAIEWLRRGAEAGDPATQMLYGAALLRGRGVPVDLVEGANWVEKAAQAGDARALDLLGVCHTLGWGRAVDHGRARELFERACEAGNAFAHYNLATLYAKGLGIDQDKARAARLYQTGADLGDAECMHALGRCLEAGFGLSRDLDGAAAWMRRAASLGHHDAMAWCLRQGVAMEVAAKL